MTFIILGTIQQQEEEVDPIEGIDNELRNIIAREKEFKRVKYQSNSQTTTSTNY